MENIPIIKGIKNFVNIEGYEHGVYGNMYVAVADNMTPVNKKYTDNRKHICTVHINDGHTAFTDKYGKRIIIIDDEFNQLPKDLRILLLKEQNEKFRDEETYINLLINNNELEKASEILNDLLKQNSNNTINDMLKKLVIKKNELMLIAFRLIKDNCNVFRLTEFLGANNKKDMFGFTVHWYSILLQNDKIFTKIYKTLGSDDFDNITKHPIEILSCEESNLNFFINTLSMTGNFINEIDKDIKSKQRSEKIFDIIGSIFDSYMTQLKQKANEFQKDIPREIKQYKATNSKILEKKLINKMDYIKNYRNIQMDYNVIKENFHDSKMKSEDLFNIKMNYIAEQFKYYNELILELKQESTNPIEKIIFDIYKNPELLENYLSLNESNSELLFYEDNYILIPKK